MEIFQVGMNVIRALKRLKFLVAKIEPLASKLQQTNRTN